MFVWWLIVSDRIAMLVTDTKQNLEGETDEPEPHGLQPARQLTTTVGAAKHPDRGTMVAQRLRP